MHRAFSSSLILAAGLVLGLGAAAAGCSLGNVAHDDCKGDGECTSLFGLGSKCQAGFCTSPPACKSGHDCQRRNGGGACVDGLCTATLPKDPTCTVFEPEDLYDRSAIGDDARLILGGIFSLEEDFDQAQTKAVRLAIREMNRSGKGIAGREFGVVFCDNGGPGNMAEGAPREALNRHALDYLSGTLGVPALVGPLSSRDATTLIDHLVKQQYPTVIISPSATSPSLSAPNDKLDEKDALGLFWRTCPSDELQGKVLGGEIGNDATIAKVDVIYLQDPYGEGLATVFQATFPRTTVLKPFTIDTDSGLINDLTKIASAANADKPDAVLVIAVQASDTVAILKELAKLPIKEKKFFFTDGSKDASKLLDPKLPPDVQSIILASEGTAPAAPQGANYNLFKTNLDTDFGLDADSFSFLAQSYDATYCVAYGALYAETASKAYDGRLVAEGLSRLSAGPIVNIAPTEWANGKAAITSGSRQMNIKGTSGDLDFDPAKGEAPGPIEIWTVAPDLKSFLKKTTVTPN